MDHTLVTIKDPRYARPVAVMARNSSCVIVITPGGASRQVAQHAGREGVDVILVVARPLDIPVWAIKETTGAVVTSMSGIHHLRYIANIVDNAVFDKTLPVIVACRSSGVPTWNIVTGELT